MSDKEEMDQVRRLLERLEKGLDPTDPEDPTQADAVQTRPATPTAGRHVSVLPDPEPEAPSRARAVQHLALAVLGAAAIGGGAYFAISSGLLDQVSGTVARSAATSDPVSPPRPPPARPRAPEPPPTQSARLPEPAVVPAEEPVTSPTVTPPAAPPAARAPERDLAEPEDLLVTVTDDMANGRIRSVRRRLEATDIDNEPDLIWALARAYDPNVLQQVRTPDAAPNAARAAELYRRWHAVSVAKGLVSSDVSADRLIRSLGLSTEEAVPEPAEPSR